MDTNQLLKNEAEIVSSSNQQVTLTTHRIIYDDKQIGKSKYTSIMLEKISSIEVHYRSWPQILILGIIAIAAGLVFAGQEEEQASLLCGGIGLFFCVLYLLSRKHFITISSDGGTRINLLSSGLKREALLKFVNQIDQAKDERGR
ncbi:MAG TPA: hypothetical protein VGF79_02235 [Bacteroidia bacterium]